MVRGCEDSCRCKRCELRLDGRQNASFRYDRLPSLTPPKPKEEPCLEEKPSPTEVPAEVEVEPTVEPKPMGTEMEELELFKMYDVMRTTNQEYGLWMFDPYLRDKDWFKTKRYPLKSSYLTRHYHEAVTGTHL
ncbi:unnamed protein product [Nezara viridula]|uniref:Uncharacterized protein n=1 Tax=Nezara viridula TaxID=85310 RepID=A0A9P0H3N8_NEZVI|nr:unnamed protein product [Nezara viridula]